MPESLQLKQKQEIWFQICTTYFNSPSEDGERILTWFNAVGPHNNIEGAEGGNAIAIIDSTVLEQIQACGMTSDTLGLDDHSMWYEYDKLRNAARLEAHKQNSRKRIDNMISMSERFSSDSDSQGDNDSLHAMY